MTGNVASAWQTSRCQAQSHKMVKWVAQPWQYVRLCPKQFTDAFYRESKQLYLMHRNKHREAAKLRKQRNMAQMKEQNKTPEKELSETKIANLSDAKFKTLVIKMLKEFIEHGNSIKKTQAEMKVALGEIKKKLQGTNSGEDEAKNQINDLEHKEGKSIQSEQQEEN